MDKKSKSGFTKMFLIPSLILVILLGIFIIFDLYYIGGSSTILVSAIDESNKNIEYYTDDENIAIVSDIGYERYTDTAFVKIKAVGKGQTTLHVMDHSSGKASELAHFNINVKAFNIILQDNWIGSMDNVWIILIEIVILLLIMLINLLFICIRESGKTIYSYRLMYYIGITIFVGMTLSIWIFSMLMDEYFFEEKLYIIYSDILEVFMRFTLFMFPFNFIFSILLAISNIILLKKEGRHITNALGILLGILLVGLSIASFTSYGFLEKIIDVHSYLGYHISIFVENTINILLTYLDCLMISAIICTLKAEKNVPPLDRDYMIILGCAIRKDGTPTPLLRGRADRALWFAEKQKAATGKELTFIASGGQGNDEVISESESIRNYLIEKGISSDRIILENRSVSTYENMKYSYDIIKNDIIKKQAPEAKVSFSTTGYHAFRSGHLAEKLGMNISGVGSKTKLYFYVNAWIREFIANLNNERKKHIINILALIIIQLILTSISYFFNIS